MVFQVPERRRAPELAYKNAIYIMGGQINKFPPFKQDHFGSANGRFWSGVRRKSTGQPLHSEQPFLLRKRSKPTAKTV
jgi:hypothetical protein